MSEKTVSQKKEQSSKPAPKAKKESQRIASQDVIPRAIGTAKRMEIAELVKACKKIEPSKEETSYLSIAHHEFKIERDDNGKVWVHPEISEQGLISQPDIASSAKALIGLSENIRAKFSAQLGSST